MRTRTLGLIIGAVLLIALAVGGVFAQDDAEPPITLTLTSTDALFQALAPGAYPVNADFARELAISTDTEQSVIYVAVQNTGWSAGEIVLLSDALDPEADYLALEVDADNLPRPDGLAFPLAYDAELGDEGGFVLPVLIAQGRTLAIFRVANGDGLAVAGVTNVRENGTVVQQPIEAIIDAEPVFGPLVLDLHIIALPDLPPAPPDDAGDDAVNGDWGACGSCDTCGQASNECVLDPAGACVWNPGMCASAGAGGAGDDGPGGPSGGQGGGGQGGGTDPWDDRPGDL